MSYTWICHSDGSNFDQNTKLNKIPMSNFPIVQKKTLAMVLNKKKEQKTKIKQNNNNKKKKKKNL